MTCKTSPASSQSSGPTWAGSTWDQALDWLLRVQAAPEDRQLREERDMWLAQDASHAQAYDRAEQVWHLTGALPRRAQSRPPLHWRHGFAVAATLAACLILWLVPDLGVWVKADYRTGAGEVRDVTLPDGSIISLGADSAIALLADRSVDLLEGRAFFAVKRDTVHPFTVTAGQAKIRVLGTAFDVLLADRAVAVAVESGSVSVGADPARIVALQAGQRAIVDRSDGAITTSTIGLDGVGAWRSGRLVVEGVPVAEVVEELSRHHDGLILLRDPALGARRVTGVFDLRDPEAALRAVLKPYGGQILHITPYLVLVEGS